MEGGLLNNTSGCFNVDDDILNFSLEDEDETAMKEHSFSSSFSDTISRHHDDNNLLFPELEEELEWLSNKDAFPSVESCLDILSGNPNNLLDHHSPISVLENSSSSTDSKNNGNGSTVMSCFTDLRVPVSYPVGKRSKRRRSRRKAGVSDLIIQQSAWLNEVNVVSKKKERASPPSPMTTDNGSASIGRRCLHCQADKTPQWRAGPMGPKTLCNACGVRYKSGRLVPEYRPANSPTFSPAAHSNSHRKIVEMRRQKQMTMGGDMEAHRACGYTLG